MYTNDMGKETRGRSHRVSRTNVLRNQTFTMLRTCRASCLPTRNFRHTSHASSPGCPACPRVVVVNCGPLFKKKKKLK